ncbi:FadR/GntR family transcriptional regulator [Frankia canadensis]|uniref:FadR/GntR family transcriptional regulator n=1 Tax=Frankia canadensis TaxID=1836972 RepID=UPI001A9C3297|nr:FCD domain-containing protein [Frankia canadensis]
MKLARRLARRIEDDIARDGWRVGTSYASETDLLERYGVSRAVLREAIRLVEHHGVATMRRGRRGGLVLRAPDAAPLTIAVVVYLEYIGTTIEDLLEVRMLVEPLAARLAAQALTEDNIVSLRRVLAAERERGELDPAARGQLHRLLGSLGGNPALSLFVDVLCELTTRYATVPPAQDAAHTRALCADSDRAHAAIVEAIVAGDAALAERRMLRHLTAMRDWLLSTSQEPIARRPSLALAAPGGGKLAETVARRLMSEIIASGARVGEIFGSETELQARLDVSRAVFREAIRLLEYHSVARMRRGPYGGLVISEPDPSASIDAMAVYLDYRGVDAAQLRVVRDVAELGAIGLLVARGTDGSRGAALRAAHQVTAATPPEQVAALSHHFHLRIAELAGNQILALFLQIMLTVSARHAGAPVPPGEDRWPADADAPAPGIPPAVQPTPEATPEAGTEAGTVHDVHGRILEAILAGDGPLAQYRMRRHLQALDAWWA